MSRSTSVFVCLTSALAAALLAAVIFIAAGGNPPRPVDAGPVLDLALRLDALETNLEHRLERLEEEVRGFPVGRERTAGAEIRRPEAEGPPARTGEGTDPAVLGSRLDAILLRLKALEEDPISRGYSFIASGSEELRREGIRSLRRIGRFDPAARAAIRELLADPSPRVRLEALEAMRELRDRESIPAISALLGDGEAMIRRQGIETLRDLESRESAGAISEILLADPDRRVRESAADSLGSLKSPAAAGALLQALGDENGEVRGQAIASLGEIGAREAAPALRALYDAGPGEHRMRLVQALRALGDTEVPGREVARLSALAASDPDAKVRRRAVEDLGRLDRDGAKEVLTRAAQDADPEVRRTARGILERRQ